MVLELNRMLEGFIDESSAREAAPTYREPNGFLKNVIIPLFEVVQAVSSFSHRLQKEKNHLNKNEDIHSGNLVDFPYT